MNLTYYIDGISVPRAEFWKRLFKKIGVEDLEISLPRARFYAMEYGEPLPKTPQTFGLIRKALMKECMLTGAELEAKTKQQYKVFTEKHVPYPFIDSISDVLADLDTDDLRQGKFKSSIHNGIIARLREYNKQGICTLGLEDEIEIHSKRE